MHGMISSYESSLPCTLLVLTRNLVLFRDLWHELRSLLQLFHDHLYHQSSLFRPQSYLISSFEHYGIESGSLVWEVYSCDLNLWLSTTVPYFLQANLLISYSNIRNRLTFSFACLWSSWRSKILTKTLQTRILKFMKSRLL